MSEAGSKTTVWWGDFTLGEGEAGCWRVGPSMVWVARLAGEWRFVYVEDEEPLHEVTEVSVPIPPDGGCPALDALPEGGAISRFSFEQTDPRLLVIPVLADRPVVVRPEIPLYVAEGETVTLYVSTPLWLRFEAGDPPRLLQEVPSHRPSDTWYGPDTREGELCYASRTAGRLMLEELPLRTHRAITPIRIRNRAHDAMLVERIQLPVGYLALFQAHDAYLWTQEVTLERTRDGGLAGLHIAEGPPARVAAAERISEPREMARTSLIGRTFSTLFHRIKEG